MHSHDDGCPVCQAAGLPEKQVLSRVVIEGRTVRLCRAHAADVASAMPETFDDLRKLFVGVTTEEGAERRSPIPRRAPDDRRVFPPRPEGRRRTDGRRMTDAGDLPEAMLTIAS